MMEIYRAPAGQVALAAGGNVGLAPATGAADSLDPNVRGVFVNASNLGHVVRRGSGVIWNQSDGLIEADQGNITLSTYDQSFTSSNKNGVVSYTAGSWWVSA